jgi:hypothetical protein
MITRPFCQDRFRTDWMSVRTRAASSQVRISIWVRLGICGRSVLYRDPDGMALHFATSGFNLIADLVSSFVGWIGFVEDPLCLGRQVRAAGDPACLEGSAAHV